MSTDTRTGSYTLLMTFRSEYAETTCNARNYGTDQRQEVSLLGGFYRLDEGFKTPGDAGVWAARLWQDAQREGFPFATATLYDGEYNVVSRKEFDHA